MDIRATTDNIIKVKVDAILVNYYEGMEKLDGDIAAVDNALGGAISQLVKQGDIKGKLNETALVYGPGKLPAARRVAICGLGKQSDLTTKKVRGAVAESCRWLRGKGVKTLATNAQGTGINDITLEDAAQAVTEGAILGLYTFRKYITKKDEDFGEIGQLSITGNKKSQPPIEKAIARGSILAEAATLARDMVNEPANYMTPTRLSESAIKLAKKYGLDVTVLGKTKMAKMGMGALLAVAQGSHQLPKLIALRYRGKKSRIIDLALIGKGITFDSGGISIKPSEGMADMKGDMAGGASVIAALTAIAQLKLKLNVTAIVPATENLPGGSALKPGDIITTMSGKTIEVLNTDAEGRLILSDALGYANKLGARKIVDVATLTGACVVALGKICTGAFSNNQELADKVIAASKDAGEFTWQMPLCAEYREQLKSDVADIKNIGGRYGGAITGAKFLDEFAGDTPWVHLDIAGTSDTDKDKDHLVKGATGVPVRTLVNLALALAEGRTSGKEERL